MAVARCMLLILFAYIITVSGDDPRVTIISTDPPLDQVSNAIIQEKDKDVQLTCVVENKPLDSEIQWTVKRKNSSIVYISTATRSYDAFRWAIDKPSPTGWRLRIQNAQVTDEGIYTCQVQVVSQNYIPDQRELRIVQVPRISDLVTSSDMTKNADDPASLECYASGRPVPLVKWTRLAGELLPNGGTEFQGNVLAIDRIQADDAGIYKCTASNSAGTDTREIRLTVNFRPEVSTSQPYVSQALGYSKQLFCDIKGYPPPTGEQISWSREGRPVISNNRVKIINIPGASNRIASIVDISYTTSEDFGRYRCAAQNDKGRQEVALEFRKSDTPTGGVRGGAVILSLNIATVVMLVSVCLLQRL